MKKVEHWEALNLAQLFILKGDLGILREIRDDLYPAADRVSIEITRADNDALWIDGVSFRNAESNQNGEDVPLQPGNLFVLRKYIDFWRVADPLPGHKKLVYDMSHGDYSSYEEAVTQLLAKFLDDALYSYHFGVDYYNLNRQIEIELFVSDEVKDTAN